MKVLHLCDHYRPIGGAEKLLFDTLETLEKTAGVTNVIVTHNYRENAATGKRPEYIVDNLDLPPVNSDFFGYYMASRRAAKRLGEIIAYEKPDVVHIHNLQNPFVTARAVKELPVVRSIHDPRLYCFNNWRIITKTREICPYPLGHHCITEGCLMPDLLKYTIDGKSAFPRYLLYLTHRKVDKLIVESAAMRECVLQNQYREEQIAYLPNFTKTFDFNEVMERSARLARPEENSILFVGRASFEKGIDYLLEAAALIKMPFKLHLVTGGPTMPEVMDKIKKLGISDRVEVPGIQNYEKTRDYYSMADVVVVPSVWIESFCLVGIEAMANGKPVVAFRTGGIPDWLDDGKTGYLAECRNAVDLAEKITKVLSDKKRAKEMGIAGYRRVEKYYTKDVYIPRLMGIYESGIAAGKQRLGR